MKIAVWHNLPSGGGKRALSYHVRGLLERGHTLESWCLSTADRSYLPFPDEVPEHVVPFKPRDTLRRGRIGAVTNEYRNTIERLRAVNEACAECARQIEKGAFDVLFANSCVLFYMPFIMRHVKMPKVLYLQEPFRPLYEANPTLPWIAEEPTKRAASGIGTRIMNHLRLQSIRIQAREEWINAQVCGTLLANSHYSRESMLRIYGRDARVCYLGVDTTVFRSLNRERERFIVGVGSFDPIKGIDLAVQAVARLKAPRPPLVWIANSGNPAYQDQMTNLAQSLDVELKIRMGVSDAELVDTLNAATLLLYTSHLEPFGFAPLEANACATPVVAVAEGGIRETIKEGLNGFLTDREPEALAAAMEKLLNNPALAREIGENALTHVNQTWSVRQSVERLEANLLRAIKEVKA